MYEIILAFVVSITANIVWDTLKFKSNCGCPE